MGGNTANWLLVLALGRNMLLLLAAAGSAASCPAGDPIAFDRQADGAKIRDWEDCRRACRADSDCLAIPAECPGWSAINKQYEAEFHQHFADLRPRLNCPAAHAKAAMPQVACMQQLCAVKP